MGEDLDSICRRIVCEPLPEAADWQNYYQSLTNLAVKIFGKNKENEFFFSGSLGEGGKFFRADDLGDVDIMISSLKYIPSSEDLINVKDWPGFVKIKITTDGVTTLYPAESLSHCFSAGLSVSLQPLLTLVTNSFPMTGLRVTPLASKSHGAAYPLDSSSSLPPPSLQLEDSPRKLNPLQKSVLYDFGHALAYGFGDENSQQTYEENIKQLCDLEFAEQQHPPDMLKTLNLLEALVPENVTKDTCNLQEMNKTSKSLAAATPVVRATNAEETTDNVDTPARGNCLDKSAQVVQAENEVEASEVIESQNRDPDLREAILPTSCDQVNSLTTPRTVSSDDYAKQVCGQFIASRIFSPGDQKTEAVKSEMSPEYGADETPDHLPRKSGIDIVPALKCTGWPDIASEWLLRKRRWPNEEKMAEIKNGGFHLVAKYPVVLSGQEMAEFVFRLSFSFPENVLCSAMTEVQLQCYQLLKALHHEHLKLLSEHFTSYHVKTILFWACEENEPERWDNVGECILLLLYRLSQALEERSLKHYFIDQCDLFVDFTEKEYDDLSKHINEILTSPKKYFQNLNAEIQLAAENMVRKIKATNTAAPPEEQVVIPDALKIKPFRQLHAEEVARTGQEILSILESGELPSDDKPPDFHYIIATLKEAISTGKLSCDGFKQILSVSTEFLYNRHAINFSDMMNCADINSIVLSDFLLLADWVSDLSSKSNEDLQAASSAEGSLNLVMSSMENGGFDLSQFFPTGENIVDSMSKLFFQ